MKNKKLIQVSPKNLAKSPLFGEVVRVFKDGKTARIRVFYTIIHQRYKKVIRKYTDYLAHLEREVQIGERVGMRPCRRISKRKSWVVMS